MGKITKACLGMVRAMMVAVMTARGMLAIYYSDILTETLRACCAGLFGLATAAALTLYPTEAVFACSATALFATLCNALAAFALTHNRPRPIFAPSQSEFLSTALF